MVIFTLTKLVDQEQRELAVKFYCTWYTIRTGVCVLVRKIRLAMSVVVEP